MNRTLDVLLIESELDAGAHAAAELEADGHRVHRCLRPSSRSAADHGATARCVATSDETAAAADAGPGLCVAVTDGTCPIDDRGIDVALLSGPAAGDRPSLLAAGVTCALRNHIPLVADDGCTSPLGSRLAGRADGDVVAACTRAAADGFSDLRTDILRRAALTLAAEHLDPGSIDLRFDLDGPRLRVTVVGPPLTKGVQQALGVRVLDAVRAAGRVFAQVDVGYDDAT